jgi:hypothetical protein
MKSKEDVLEHLLNNGYDKMSIAKIMGFLIGFGYKEEAEKIKFRVGSHSWSDFWSWFNEEPQSVIHELISELYLAYELEDDERKRVKLATQIEALKDVIENGYKGY